MKLGIDHHLGEVDEGEMLKQLNQVGSIAVAVILPLSWFENIIHQPLSQQSL